MRYEKISFDKDRVLLAEVLPYEIPSSLINFNEKLYRFVKKNKISITPESDDKWRIECHRELEDYKICNIRNIVIAMLFGGHVEVDNKIKSNGYSIPFNFNILKGHRDRSNTRTLSIIHPCNQLMIAWLYQNYSSLMLYYASLSPFSIRKPYKVANFTQYKANSNSLSLPDDEDKSSRVLSYKDYVSFFKYHKFDGVYKFYDSKIFQEYEKKYSNMCTLDVSHCFDSIYTHSIDWAIWDKELAKLHIHSMKKSFSGIFDRIMQNLNYKETNGIVIGPEFSRIFAELIMQDVDVNIYRDLRKNGKYENKDYAISRYVDDYFVFYNSDEDIDLIRKTISHRLKEYKLSLNDTKSANYEIPIATPITIAKTKINKLIRDNFKFSFIDDTENNDGDKCKSKDFPLNSHSMITEIKNIIKESDVSVDQVLNFTLDKIDRVCRRSIKRYYKIHKDNKINKDSKQNQVFFDYLTNAIKIAFFFYSLYPAVNPSLKVGKIIINVINLANYYVGLELKHHLYKYVYDQIKNVLNSNPADDFTPVESLHLLLILKGIERSVNRKSNPNESANKNIFDYKIPLKELEKYLGITRKENQLDKKVKNHLQAEPEGFTYALDKMNYLSIMVVLWYIEDNEVYENLQDAIVSHIREQLECSRENLLRDTEKILMLFDTLSCPYIDIEDRKRILERYLGKVIINKQKCPDCYDIIEYIQRHIYFTDWKGEFRLDEVLRYKERRAVY